MIKLGFLEQQFSNLQKIIIDKNTKCVVRKKNATIFNEITPAVKRKGLEGISLFCSYFIVGHNSWWYFRFV